MHIRLAYSLALTLALAPLGACGSDDDDSSDGGEHNHKEDGGEHHHEEDSGEHHHEEDGGEHHAEDGGDHGGSCPHMGAVVECDEDIDTVGAMAEAEDGTTVEVVGVMPGELTAGADGKYMLMLMISDADGEPVEDGVELDRVYTMAHGGHASCGAPELLNMGGGSYHIHDLTYPHGGTWYHDLELGDETLSLAVCVGNE